jgi:hypothetical protein
LNGLKDTLKTIEDMQLLHSSEKDAASSDGDELSIEMGEQQIKLTTEQSQGASPGGRGTGV